MRIFIVRFFFVFFIFFYSVLPKCHAAVWCGLTCFITVLVVVAIRVHVVVSIPV